MIKWMLKHWSLIILLIIGLFWLKNRLPVATVGNYSKTVGMASMDSGVAQMEMMPSTISFGNRNEVAPSDSTTRLVITDTSLSLQVKDVSKTIGDIENTAKNIGGYLISSNLSKPEEAASGTISVRIPEEKRSEAMGAFKGMAIKVVSESIQGRDVTDQYTDIEARLEILNKTKIKYEEILAKAYSVNDLLSVQQQLVNLQSQIDNLKGQQKYYEQSAKLSKIVVYLSTDDLSLPYAPTDAWRPVVVLKQAVRALLLSIRDIGNLLIWVVVFIPIWVPAIWIIRLIRRRLIKN